MNKWRAELHCHSNYSKHDGVLTPKQIIDICKKRKIDVIALTDHNEIEGAKELQKTAPDWLTVIVSEEITTRQGDIIGMFLKEKIVPFQDIRETISKVKKQGGLVFIPHPMDRLRTNAVGEAVLSAIKREIDAVEIFNARNVFDADNQKIKKWARDNRAVSFVGSDAHFAKEFGKAVCLMDKFEDKNTFLNALGRAQFQSKKSSLLVHILTKWVKMGDNN